MAKWTKKRKIEYRKQERKSLMASGLTERECDTWVRIEPMSQAETKTWAKQMLALLERQSYLLKQEIQSSGGI